MSTRHRKPLFERLKQDLEEGIAHARGETPLKTVVMYVTFNGKTIQDISPGHRKIVTPSGPTVGADQPKFTAKKSTRNETLDDPASEGD